MEIIFSKQLKQLRTEVGLTQAQLAERLNSTQRNVSYLEAGKVEPDLDMLWRIADFFDVSIDYLIGRKDV
jgi:transcriptional regulator with XRE-family HTH domain